MRRGELRKAVVDSDKLAGTSQPLKSQYIDFFDGTNVGYFDLMPEEHRAPNATWLGMVFRHRGSPLPSSENYPSHVADCEPMDRSVPPHLSLLLLQTPFSALFSVSSSDWIVEDDHCVITTRDGHTVNWRATVSQTTGCPLKLEQLSLKDARTLRIYEVTQTQFVDGIEVPSEVLVHGGSREKYVERYLLQSCQLNDAVDVHTINLPPSTHVRDFRLGEGKEVEYTSPGGRWIDAPEISHRYTEAQRQHKKRRQASIALAVIPALSAIGLGLALKKKSDIPRNNGF